MGIGKALLMAAMMLSGIVVVTATSASAQNYAPGYQPTYRPAYQPTYQGGGGVDGGGRYDPRGGDVRQASATAVYEDTTVGYAPAPRYGYEQRVSAPVYAPRYATPTYARPRYVPPSYVAPVDQCRERGW